MNRDLMFSSKTDQWATPVAFFQRWDSLFDFGLDVCADAANAKCARFFDVQANGLAQEWRGTCWLNPPYGRTIDAWVRKAYESARAGAIVVCLLPARVDTRWWHTYCAKGCVIFLRGRLKFGDAKTGAPFPSAIVIFGGGAATHYEKGGAK